MSPKTVEIPDDWQPPEEEPKPPQWAFLRHPFSRTDDPLDELKDMGWRCVGVDENGEKLYAPPARYSHWTSWP